MVSKVNQTPSPQEVFALGYRELVSITVPGGLPSPKSALDPSQMGKSPGHLGQDGFWRGYDWINAPAVFAEDMETWGKAGAGLRATHFPAIDIDCLDEELAASVGKIALKLLGAAPVRIGRAPKRLLVYRTGTPFARKRLWFGERHLVEVLGRGQQYVVSGIHPDTHEPYHWPAGMPEAGTLTPVSEDKVDAFLRAVAIAMEAQGLRVQRQDSRTRGARAVDQESLRGDLRQIKKAVEALPNTNTLFPTRISYVALGAAVKAAVGDEEGLPIFTEWAMRWPGNDRAALNTEESIAADWARLKPPFDLGADYLLGLARTHGGLDVRPEDFDFDAQAQQAELPPIKGAVEFSEAAVARLFLKRFHPRVRYALDRGVWLHWSGAKWEHDNGKQAGRVYHLSGLLCQQLSNVALETMTSRDGGPSSLGMSTATRLASLRMKNAVVNYAQTDPRVQVTERQLDADDFLLNTPMGIVDLEKGIMSDPDSTRLMTRATAVSPNFAPAPRWLHFLTEATGGDVELIAYLQRLCGYVLTGSKREHLLAFVYGSGGNGKSVFLDTLHYILGEYATVANMNTFTATRFARHPTDLASLAGHRLVIASETQANTSWDEQRIKELSSDGDIQARFTSQDFFTYRPTFKLVFSGNHRPRIEHLDDAMRRRLQIIPFTNKPAKPDRQLPEKLRAEGPQILAWCVEGTRHWLEQGTNPPAAVRAATSDYFADSDVIGQWMAEALEQTGNPDDFAANGDMYDNWREWCGANGVTDMRAAMTSRQFSREVANRPGVVTGRIRAARGIRGVRIKADTNDEAWA